MISSILILSLSLLSFLYLLSLFKRKTLKLPPSPPKLPIIGNLHQIGTLPHRSFQALSAKYGPLFLFYFGNSPALVVSSAEAAAQILKTHDVAFSGRPRMTATEILFYGCRDLVFCPNSDYRRKLKRIFVEELLSPKQVQAFRFVREEVATNMVDMIRLSCFNNGANSNSVDMSDLLLSVSNNMISISALGRVYETEGDAGGGRDTKTLGKLTRRVVNLIGGLCVRDIFPSLGWIDVLTGLLATLNATFKELDEFLDKVIEEHESLGSDPDNKNDKRNRKDLVDIFLHLQKDGMPDMDLTRENLKAILLDAFVGGTDTAAAAMEWAMAELIKNPGIMRKVQEEIRGVVGDQKRKICEADISKMSYLRNVVKETLRLHGPLILRETCTDVKLEGYDVPAKTRVFVNAWAIQRDPKVWERPEEFDPDRFAAANGASAVDCKGQHAHLTPFGGGRRVCPGISFAVAEMEFVLANLLYWFDWNLPNGASPDDLDMDEANALVIRRKTHLVLVPQVRCL